MAYLLFLLANAALFFRPAEIIPSLGDVKLYLYLITAAIVCASTQIERQVRLTTLLQQPINLCLLGMTVSVATSHLTTGGLSLLGTGLFEMLKLLLYYLTLVSVIVTTQRLRTFLAVTAICSSAMVLYSIMDYRAFVQEWEGRSDLAEIRELERDLPEGAPRILRHVADEVGRTPDNAPIWVFRICGLGMFHDPNDLASLAVVTTVIALYFLTQPGSAGTRYLWLCPLGLMGTAVFLTHSRGGLLAFGVAAMVWAAVRYGKQTAIAMGLMGAAAVPVLLGRQGNLDIGGGTGQQRIQLWADGLAQLRTLKFPFGIGEGRYHEIAGLAAHNSYVHAYVELGFFGGTMFFGCFFFAAWAFWRLIRSATPLRDPELIRLMPYAAAMLAGWCTGMATLSRCYTVPTYMIIGTAAAFINLAGYHQPRPRPLLELDHLIVQRWVLCSLGFLACCFAFVQLFVRWGARI